MTQLPLPFESPFEIDQELIDEETLTPEEKEAKRIRLEIAAERANPLTPPTYSRYRDALVFPAADNQLDDEEE